MDREKYVDESWKESATKEKEKLKQMMGRSTPQTSSDHAEKTAASHRSPEPVEPQPEEHQPSSSSEGAHGINFINYVTSLGFQALIFMGEIPHPMTNQIEKNLEQSKFIIDTLAMLREKTKGNLTKQESDLVNTTLYELQLKYVDAVNADVSAPQEPVG